VAGPAHTGSLIAAGGASPSRPGQTHGIEVVIFDQPVFGGTEQGRQRVTHHDRGSLVEEGRVAHHSSGRPLMPKSTTATPGSRWR